MKIYVVGGAVRDALLGLPVHDRDYVVVGATPSQMIALGFKPVGKDFPVFLHPQTHEEYALARTERKTAPGYTGFAFHAAADVTLEEDLGRRDLTINAIAQDEDGVLIDPYGGVADLRAKILRHVGSAFVEDPVRILRIARLSARYVDFSIAPETRDLLRAMVNNGEVDHLVAERVWQELAKGLMEAKPSRMLQLLHDCGALQRLIPELATLFGVPQRADHHPEVDTGLHTLLAVDQAALAGLPLAARYAVMVHDLGKGQTPVEMLPQHIGHESRGIAQVQTASERLKVPTECRDLALLATRFHGEIHCAQQLRAGTLVNLLESCDAIRRPSRFELLLEVCASDYRGRLGYADQPYPPANLLRCALTAARSVDAAAIAAKAATSGDIPQRLHQERARAVKAMICPGKPVL